MLTVVMYHYVRELKNSQFPKIKGLDIKLFEEQLEYLLKNYNIISNEQLIESFNKNELPNNSALLTFDDGSIDHYEFVFPILQKFKIKGLFFTPAKIVEENTILDVNKIQYLIASYDSENDLLKDLSKFFSKYEKKYNLHKLEYYFKRIDTFSRFDSKNIVFIKRLLQKELKKEVRAQILNDLFNYKILLPEKEFSKKIYINSAQIKEMVKEGMSFGIHGYDHLWWNTISEKEILNEINCSKNFVINHGMNEEYISAAYPYGAYNQKCKELLKKENIKIAFTTKVNTYEVNKNTAFEIPRLDTNDLPKNKNSKKNQWLTNND